MRLVNDGDEKLFHTVTVAARLGRSDRIVNNLKHIRIEVEQSEDRRPIVVDRLIHHHIVDRSALGGQINRALIRGLIHRCRRDVVSETHAATAPRRHEQRPLQ